MRGGPRRPGLAPRQLTDCGVAGLHRLLAELDTLAMADAIVVIAGMEGALASVVGGLTPAPVVAVPTSTGYGAALEGVTALLAMLSACSSGITVVGIDNGYGAACAIAGFSRDVPGDKPHDGGLVHCSPASPATWLWDRWSTPALMSTRSGRSSTDWPSPAGTSNSKGHPGRHRLHPGRRRW